MDIRQLRYFVAVAESGTISRAAALCQVTQPSMSQQIINLEDDLGMALFDRLGRGVVLTEAGKALLPRARKVLAQIQEIESGVRDDLGRGRGRIAIGAIPTMAPYVLPPLVAQLRGEFPHCEILVREDLTQNLVQAIADNELDVAVMSTPVKHDLIDLEVVGREPLLVVARSDCAFASENLISLADLRSLPTITLHEMHCLGQQINELCTSNRLAGNIVCRMTQLGTLLEFVRLGLGVSIVPGMVAAHDESAERVYLKVKNISPTREIALAWRKGRTRSRLALRFAAFLTDGATLDHQFQSRTPPLRRSS